MDYKEKVIALLNSQELSKEQKEKLEEMFPELKESEDERIRKAMIDFFKHEREEGIAVLHYGVNIERMIAWLEKQGEQNPADKPKFKVKYAGSEYNVFKTKDIAGVTFYGIEDEPNHIDYVKADNCEIISGYGIKESGLSIPTKPVMFSERNPTWSEEDEKIRKALFEYFTTSDNNAYYEVCGVATKKILVWLDKQREQKPTWSKEDEKKLLCICAWIKDYPRIADFREEMYTIANNYISWLKSLRPQNRWKPSEEQMKALANALSLAKSCCEESVFDLRTLYEQLKNL